MSELLTALKNKFETPKAVFKALGLDESIINKAAKDWNMETSGNSDIPSVGGGKKKAMDAEKVNEFLKEKLSKDDMAQYDAMCKGMDEEMDDDDDEGEKEKRMAEEKKAKDKKAKDAKRAKDMKAAKDAEEKEEKEEKKEEKTGEDEEKDEDKEEKVTKSAMDAAIKDAKAAVIKEQREIAKAIEDVAPYVGKLSLAFDSAEEVYRKALKIINVDVSKVKDASALPIILKAHPTPGSAPKSTPRLAADSASNTSFKSLFGDVQPSRHI